MIHAPLDDLAWIAASGPDARKFLQGQVSQDVLGQPADRVRLAGLHNPQGRVIAILRLVPLSAESLLLGLPREIVAAVILRLRRYVLRSKLQLEDASDAWLAAGIQGDGAAGVLETAGLHPAGAAIGALARRADGCLAWRHDTNPDRFIILAPRPAGLPAGLHPPQEDSAKADARRAWQRADVADGLPQVRSSTSEAFVAQMLNLDVLQGISFEKGCYTGQEVIARAHYRGRVKRRLQRFRTLVPTDAALAPGDSGTLADGRAFQVVESVRLGDGRVEMLAVAPLSPGAPGEDEAVVAGTPTGAVDRAPSTGAATAATSSWQVESLPLPYALPH